MRKICAALLLSAPLALAAPSMATAAAVDFESVTTDQFNAVIDADGYRWSFTAAGWFIGPGTTAFCPNCTSNGTSRLVAAGDAISSTARVLMEGLGGAFFDLASFDAATANSTDSNIIDILGTFAGGGTIFASFAIDGTFGSYSLSGFTGLSSVLFSSRNSGSYNFGGFSLDNLNNPTVPEPGSLALLGLGLAGLGLSRRRKSA